MEYKFHSVFVTVFSTIFLFGSPASTQLYENDRCHILGSSTQGICKLNRDCPSAAQQFRYSGIRPTNCGFDGDAVIICCVEGNGNQGSNPSGGGTNLNNRNPGSNFGNNVAFGQRPNTNSNTNNRGTSGNTDFNRNPSSTAGSGNFESTAAVNSRRSGRKSISERKCEEYSSRVTRVVEGLLLLPEPETLTINVPKCDYTSTPLIVGGVEADVGEFPHMALIGWPLIGSSNFKWACGGSLISDQYILTAAHCASLDRDTTVSNVEPTVIRLGDHSISKNDDGADPQEIGVESVIVHPAYDPPSKYHDIALIKMVRPARLGNLVRPACLSETIQPNDKAAVATGWGRIAHNSKTSDVLLKVSIKVIGYSQCAPVYESVSRKSLPRGLTDQQMCAGDAYKDTCQGDSGGPLQVSDETNRCIFHVIGVTSFGAGCGLANAAGVYTSVPHYVRWIEGIVWPTG